MIRPGDLDGLEPPDAILRVLGQRALTVRSVTDMLVAARYEWPIAGFRSPTPERVHARLVAMEKQKQVKRFVVGGPQLWKVEGT